MVKKGKKLHSGQDIRMVSEEVHLQHAKDAQDPARTDQERLQTMPEDNTLVFRRIGENGKATKSYESLVW